MPTDNTSEKLKQYAQKVQNVKASINHLSGRQEAIETQLQRDYNIASVEDAENLIETLNDQREELNLKLLNYMSELDEHFRNLPA